MPRFATSAALVLLAAASASQAQERRGPPGGGAPPAGGSPAPSAPAQAGRSGAAPAQAAGAATGSFQQSCRNTTTANGRVFSECRTAEGAYRRSSIEFGLCRGDIGNQNGILVCNGAVAQDGGLIAEATPAARDSGSSKGKSNSAGRDAALGALLGGLGGATLGGAATANGYTGARPGQGYDSGYANGGYANDRYGQGAYNQGGYNQGGYGAPPPPPYRSYGDRGRYDDRSYGGGDYPPPPPPPPSSSYGYGSNGSGAYPPPGGYGDSRYGGGDRGRPAMVLYDGYNYTGRAVEIFGDGEDLERLRFADRARSVRVFSGRWRLCRDADDGRCARVSRDVPDLRALNAADQIASVSRE